MKLALRTRSQGNTLMEMEGESSDVPDDRFLFAEGYIVLDDTVHAADSKAGKAALLQLARSDLPASTLNGSFAAAILDSDRSRLCLIVDTVGSYPIYYAVQHDDVHGDFFCVSTDPAIIVRESGARKFDTSTIGAMLCFGYALGPTTLFEIIREVSPASRLWVDVDEQGSSTLSIREERYWQYEYQCDIETQDEFNQAAGDVYDRLRRRYSNYAEQLDLPILIKLTAGVDSRSLLAMFFETHDVSTATYGYRGLRDFCVARSLSRQLGKEHHFAKLTGRELLTSAIVSRTRDAFGLRSLAHIGLGSVAVLNSVPAGRYVHIPGHAADFVAGSHIRSDHLGESSLDERVQLIRNFHSCVDKSTTPNLSHSSLARYLTSEHVDHALRSHAEATRHLPTWLSLYHWDLDNRQHKHILSDAAMLRSNGPVLLPFWDLDFRDLFRRSSIDLLYRQRAYKTYARQYISGRFGDRVTIDWPFNHHAIGPCLKEGLASGDWRTAFAYSWGIGCQLACGLMNIRSPEWRNRYIRSLSNERLRGISSEAVSNDSVIRQSLTAEGRTLFKERFPERLLDVKIMLDQWRELLATED